MKVAITTFAAVLIDISSAYATEPAKVQTIGDAKVYTDQNGMALYTFDKDEAGKSSCDAACLEKWPAFKAEEGATAEGDWSIVDATDGTKMWAYKGKPLYTWVDDKQPGDTTGDGVGGVWHLATAD